MSNVITPIGGAHRSAKSLLAEVMNDPGLEKCVVMTIDKEGNGGIAQFEMTRAEMCYAAAVIVREAFSEG